MGQGLELVRCLATLSPRLVGPILGSCQPGWRPTRQRAPRAPAASLHQPPHNGHFPWLLAMAILSGMT